MRFRIVIAVACATCGSAEPLRITVYDKAQLSGLVLESVFDRIRHIFRRSDIEAKIVLGDPLADEGSVVMYPGTLRPEQAARAACNARRDIAVQILPAIPSVRSKVLGMALPLARIGVNARVFADNVRDVALRHQQLYEAVLASVIAHELGHVLLRTNAHEQFGMMAGVWTRKEYEAIARGAMVFTREQSRRIHSTLIGAGCDSQR
jgi:hypothetical protein